MNHPRNYKFLVIPVLLIILLSSCGLYDYPFLEAPNVSIFGGSGNALIFNRTDNDPDVFLGYEIYYKFYNKTGFISQHASDENTIFSKNNPEPPDLLKIGFRRVNTEYFVKDNTLYPMLPVKYPDRNDSFYIRATSSLTDNIYVEYELSGYDDIFLYRNVVANPGALPDDRYYKSFLKGTDDGIVSTDADVLLEDVTLSFYVFSYGKYDLVYNIYSRPVWLGSIDY